MTSRIPIADTAPSCPAGETTGSDTARLADYIALLKPRVMSLSVFTGLAGMLAAPELPGPATTAAALVGISLGAGGSAALNMWRDADIDARMHRTRNRPVPLGRIDRNQALGFGLITSLAAVALTAVLVNPVAAGLLAFTIFFYAVVYTMWLKRTTPQNIVIGGAAGALPPVIGWVAATPGALFSPAPWSLFLIILLWTPAHFWALALMCQEDYKRASVPMLPVVAGEAATRRAIMRYALLTAAAAYLPLAAGPVEAWGPHGSLAWIAGVTALNLPLLILSGRLLRGGKTAARGLFLWSILYLFLLFLMLAGGAILARMVTQG